MTGHVSEFGEPEYMDQARRPLLPILLIAGLAVGGASLLLVLSPLLLSALDSILSVDWVQQSAIGQSYTGIGTIFSAGALLAVAYTMRLQAVQTALTREQGARAIQLDLLKMAMVDPLYAETFSGDYCTNEGDHDVTRQRMFQAMRFRYLEFQFVGGSISEKVLRFQLATRLFGVDVNREYWEDVEVLWKYEAASRKEARFVAVVSQECARSRARAADEQQMSAT